MVIRNGLVYPDDIRPVIQVCGVRPLDDHKLWVRFNNDEDRIFDFTPLLSMPAFKPLTDPEVFNGVYIEYGATVWNNGEIDIAPETLYEQGTKV